jgi:hypothetical protein
LLGVLGTRNERGRQLRRPYASDVPGIKELRNGGDKLSWRKRLRQHNAIRDALRSPVFEVLAAHVNDGKIGVDFSGVPGNVPAVELAWRKIDISDQRSIFPFGSVKQLHGMFA